MFFFCQPSIRKGAVAALRAALTVTSQRETKASQRAVYKVCRFEGIYSPVLLNLMEFKSQKWEHTFKVKIVAIL